MTQVEAIDATGRRPDGGAVEGLPGAQQIAQAAFALQQGGTGNLTEIQGGDYFIARVDAITPAALRPLDAIRDEVVAAWQAEQRSSWRPSAPRKWLSGCGPARRPPRRHPWCRAPSRA